MEEKSSGQMRAQPKAKRRPSTAHTDMHTCQKLAYNVTPAQDWAVSAGQKI